MCMLHKHPTIRKAMGMKVKWNIEFYVRIGLIPSKWLFFNKVWNGYTKDQYIEWETRKNRLTHERRVQKATEQGKVYFTEQRLRKMDYAFSR